MATEFKVIGNQKLDPSKKTEFIFEFSDCEGESANTQPKHWKHVELIATNWNSSEEFNDLMFAYDENRSEGSLFVGNWNGGKL